MNIRTQPNVGIEQHNNNQENIPTCRKNDFLLLHINIQSLKSKLNELQFWLEEMNCTVLCVNEHWLRGSNIDMFVPFGFDLATSYCRISTIRGGSSIYVKRI